MRFPKWFPVRPLARFRRLMHVGWSHYEKEVNGREVSEMVNL